jgi:3-hydroxyisobutyrate dehydrogenase-like beta-hydroxyacid dehydrogenase
VKVGFVGLGRMGSAIAARVLSGGHELTVFNRTPEKCADLGKAGAKVVRSIAEASAGRDVVISMVANDAALEEIVLGPGGLLASLPKGKIHLVMGTHGVEAIRRVDAAHKSAGQILVACPVMGRPDVAAAGQLGLLPGGPKAAVDACRPLFQVIGRRTFEAGPEPAAAAAIKLTNNFVLGCAIEVIGEAYALVEKFNVERAVMYDVLTDGLFSAPAYKVYGKIILDEAYDKVGQSAVNGFKDAELALAAGAGAGVPLPSVSVWRDRLLSAIAHGDGGKDWAVMALEQARASGLRR